MNSYYLERAARERINEWISEANGDRLAKSGTPPVSRGRFAFAARMTVVAGLLSKLLTALRFAGAGWRRAGNRFR